MVMLPVDERAPGVPRCYCNAIADGRLSTVSTSGTPTCSIRCRAYGATDSKQRRYTSAYSVPSTSDDFPDSDMPVKTTSTPCGIYTSMLFRLCSRTPRTHTRPVKTGAPDCADVKRPLLRMAPISMTDE